MLQIAFRPSCMNRASVFKWYKKFKKSRESVMDDERRGGSKEVNTLEFIGQRVSGISTRTMHPSTTPSLLQTIWPRQFLSLPIVQILHPVTFGYSLSSEAIVMRQSSRWKSLWRRSLTRSHKRTWVGPCRSCWNGTISALQPEEITSRG